MDTVRLPKATKARLILLLQVLKTWKEPKITSVQIEEITGWKDSLIRHDFWLLKFAGGVSNGYLVNELEEKIRQALGIKTLIEKEEKKKCCSVGLGRFGSALLDESFIDESNFIIKAGFDSNVNRVEILHSTFPLYPANEIQFVVKKEKIEYAILTVPQKEVAIMCARLTKAGIKGIVNMTDSVLTVPENIKVENLSIKNALNMLISE